MAQLDAQPVQSGASQVALLVKNPSANARDIRDAGSIPEWGRSPGGGRGNPLQYSCLDSGKEPIWQCRRHKETQVQSLGGEDPLEEGMATHSSTLVWRIPWTEEPGGLQPMGSHAHTGQTDSGVGGPVAPEEGSVWPRAFPLLTLKYREPVCSAQGQEGLAGHTLGSAVLAETLLPCPVRTSRPLPVPESCRPSRPPPLQASPGGRAPRSHSPLGERGDKGEHPHHSLPASFQPLEAIRPFLSTEHDPQPPPSPRPLPGNSDLQRVRH